MNRALQQTLEGTAPIERDAREPDRATRRAGLLSIAGILAALGTTSCCVVPFVLFTLGISGAWIGHLTALYPYQPIFAGVTFGCLGYGFYLIYGKPRVACGEGSYCADPRSDRMAKIGLWTAAFLLTVGLGLPKLAPLFL